MLGRALGASKIIGTDVSAARRDLALQLELVDVALPADDSALSQIKQLTNGRGCEAAVDCSGVGSARLLALKVGFEIMQGLNRARGWICSTVLLISRLGCAAWAQDLSFACSGCTWHGKQIVG